MKSVTFTQRVRLDVYSASVAIYPTRNAHENYYLRIGTWSPLEGLSLEGESTSKYRKWLADECAKAYVEKNT